MGRTNEMEARRTESKWSKPLNSQTGIDMRGTCVIFFQKKEEKEREKKKKVENNDKGE